MMPANENDPGDATATEEGREFSFGLFSDPIFKGDYSDIVKQRGGKNIRAFGDKEKEMLKGSADFYGLSYGGVKRAQRIRTQYGLAVTLKESSDWMKDVSHGLRPLLRFLRQRYEGVSMAVTAGCVSEASSLHDPDRLTCLQYQVDEVVKAVRLDHAEVVAFTYRPLLDGFEWERGYSLRSGLYHVNFSDPFRPRTPRDSAGYFARMAQARGVLREGHHFEVVHRGTSAPGEPVRPAVTSAPETPGPAGGRHESNRGTRRVGWAWGVGLWAVVVVLTVLPW